MYLYDKKVLLIIQELTTGLFIITSCSNELIIFCFSTFSGLDCIRVCGVFYKVFFLSVTIYYYHRNFLFNLLTDAMLFGSLGGHLQKKVTLIAIVVVVVIIKDRREYIVFVVCVIQVVVCSVYTCTACQSNFSQYPLVST